jgi:hypothetical protein
MRVNKRRGQSAGYLFFDVGVAVNEQFVDPLESCVSLELCQVLVLFANLCGGLLRWRGCEPKWIFLPVRRFAGLTTRTSPTWRLDGSKAGRKNGTEFVVDI